MSARRSKLGHTPQPCSRSASVGSSAAWGDGTEHPRQTEAHTSFIDRRSAQMGKGILLWLIGIPIPIILLLWIFGYLH
jgi:hypothetical protein